MSYHSRAAMLGLVLSASLAFPGLAQAQSKSIAVVDQERAIAESAAFKAAIAQLQVTYKPQLDQLNTRRAALQAELQPLVAAYETAAKAPGASEASVGPSATALQTRNAAAQRELQQLGGPVELSRAYIVEQIAAKLPPALKSVMAARKLDLLLEPQATVSYEPPVDVTAALTGELNRLVPSVQVVPPAGWAPGQRGAQAAAQPAANAQPRGR